MSQLVYLRMNDDIPVKFRNIRLRNLVSNPGWYILVAWNGLGLDDLEAPSFVSHWYYPD